MSFTPSAITQKVALEHFLQTCQSGDDRDLAEATYQGDGGAGGPGAAEAFEKRLLYLEKEQQEMVAQDPASGLGLVD